MQVRTYLLVFYFVKVTVELVDKTVEWCTNTSHICWLSEVTQKDEISVFISLIHCKSAVYPSPLLTSIIPTVRVIRPYF